MDLFAGTSKGVFQITDSIAKKVLDCRGVREIVCFNGRIFAGTGNGLYMSDAVSYTHLTLPTKRIV